MKELHIAGRCKSFPTHFGQLEDLDRNVFFSKRSIKNELVSKAPSQKEKSELMSVSDSIPASECVSVSIF